MNTITLTDDELLLVVDIVNRSKGDFDGMHIDGMHIDFEEPEYVQGYAFVVLLQYRSRLENLEKKLSEGNALAGRQPITFSVANQRMEFESEVTA